MQFIKLVKKRYSCRNFLSKPIHKKLIEKIIEAARWAPTARNIQPWEFIVITEREKLKKLGELAMPNGLFIADAGCCIAVFCKDTKYYLEDGCAATENILLASAELGLGSCWVAGDKKPYVEEIKKMLNVGADFKLVSLVALGHPKDKKAFANTNRQKRPLKKLIHWEVF